MKLGQSIRKLVKLVEDQNLVQWTNPKKEVLSLTTGRANEGVMGFMVLYHYFHNTYLLDFIPNIGILPVCNTRNI